jgi:iron-sulfur cluster assembly protein
MRSALPRRNLAPAEAFTSNEGNADNTLDTGVTKSRVTGTFEPVSYDQPMEIIERPTDTLITLTPIAAAKVKELLAEETDGEAMVLRVAIQGGGCSGFQYGLGFDTGAAEGDLELQLEGVPVVVDPFSAPYLRGATIDYLTGLQESGFKIDNPNAVSSCGCGHSFQVDEGEELPEGTEVGGCGSGCSH